MTAATIRNVKRTTAENKRTLEVINSISDQPRAL